jgi:hypothetical protein
MSLEEISFLSQIIAAVAIAISLVFVAVQLNQAEVTQRAMMHQARTQRGMDMALRSADSHLVQAMGHIIQLDMNTSPAHFVQMSSLIRAMVLNLADVAWQHKAGLLDKRTLDNTAAPLRGLFAFQGLRAVWLMNRASFAGEIADTFNSLVIEGVPVQTQAADPIAAWRAIATQLAPGHPVAKVDPHTSP